MHPTRYPTDASRVELVGTLLTDTTFSWFGPLIRKKSPLLNIFKEFIKDFTTCFKNTDIVRIAINKIRHLREGDRLSLAYAIDFHLLAYDIPWDDQALIKQFHFSLCNDVKDLLRLYFLKIPNHKY